jgi:type II secretory ATPase GspE/PulE/Tfp pilus assembly ATPase PilB-like protein
MPTMHGETVVIRLLRKEGEKAKSLAEIGMNDTDRAKLEEAIGEPQGLVLITVDLPREVDTGAMRPWSMVAG